MAKYSRVLKYKMPIFRLCMIIISGSFWEYAEGVGGAAEMRALHEKLLEGYNPLVRPSRNYSVPIDVHIELYLSAILGLDTKRQLLFLRAFLRLSWTDELLQWDSKQNGGIDRIVVPQNNIWKPDLILNNAANENDKLGNENVYIAVNSKGFARWEPPFYLESTCKLDMSKYPFDISVCPVDVLPWMDDNQTITLRCTDSPIKLEHMLVNGEYEISSAGVTKYVNQYEELFFEAVTFNIRLARRPAYIAISLLIPVNLLAVLSILSFMMPPEEPEKVNIAITVLLSFTVFLTFIDSNIPPNSDSICLLVIYISTLLLMSFLAVVGNILVVTTKHWDGGTQKDGRQMCCTSNNKEGRPFIVKTICSCTDTQDSTDVDKCVSRQSDCVERLEFVSVKRKSIYNNTRSISSQLNRAFFIISCVLFVFISSLMFALISM